MGGLQSAQLNTDATMFHRKYYKNDAHCGYIFYANALANKKIEELMAASKDVGNFICENP